MNKAEKAERREQARLRKQRERDRKQAELRERLAAVRPTTDLVPVTANPVTRDMPGEVVEAPTTNPAVVDSNALLVPEIVITPRVTLVREPILPGCGILFTVAVAVALALAGTGIVINAWYARSLGSTEFAGWLFLAIGMATDIAALILPTVATLAWKRSPVRSLAAWALWAMTFAFALSASLGFASLNITDVTMVRSERSTPGVVEAQAALVDAEAAAKQECTKLGPICRRRQDTVAERQQALNVARGAVASVADPQTTQAAKLIAWISRGWLVPTADDFMMLRLTFLTLLPQIGGLVLMVARR